MIVVGSRKLLKICFTVIDLGITQPDLIVEQQTANHEFYLENLRDDTEIELYFKFTMSPELRAKFSKTEELLMLSTN
jgi:ABC-type Zn2+ transport system substrate-binding protein/surface adhesin